MLLKNIYIINLSLQIEVCILG